MAVSLAVSTQYTNVTDRHWTMTFAALMHSVTRQKLSGKLCCEWIIAFTCYLYVNLRTYSHIYTFTFPVVSGVGS